MKIKTPQFRVDDIVYYRNDFSFNPACKVLCIGRITSVNIYTGTGQISYCVTGVGVVGVNISEDDLTAFDTMHDLMAEINDEKTTNQLVLQAGHRCRSGDEEVPPKKIITEYEKTTFPSRRLGWSAHYAGEKESGIYGRGATEQEAIDDLIEN